MRKILHAFFDKRVLTKPNILCQPLPIDRCEEAFNFYKSVFGGEFCQISKFGDMPSMPGQEFSEAEKKLLLHFACPSAKKLF